MARTRSGAKRATRKTPPAAAFARIKSAAGTLLEQGVALRDQARSLAIAKAGEALDRTTGAMSRLETVFEARVSQVVQKLGVPRASDVRALSRQVARLQQSVDQLRRGRARA